jgi:hypothetical protein
MDRNLKIIIGLSAVVCSLIITVIVGPIIWSAEDHDEVKDQENETIEINLMTHPATNISTMFVTLNGELTDLGDLSSVDVFFLWGENPGEYTMETQKQTITSPGNFSAEISDLFMPNSTYYFQARSDPEGHGEELSFYVE